MKISNTPFSFSWPWKVRKIIRSVDAAVVNIHMPVPGIGDLAAFFTRGPMVITYHTGSMRKGKLIPDIITGTYEHLVLPCLLHRATHIICASDFIRTTFLKPWEHKAVTLTPGVDSLLYAPRPSMRAASPTIVFATGRLNRGDAYKGLDTLIKALPMIAEKIDDLHITVIGDGDHRLEYEKQVEAVLPGRGKFTGFLHGDQLAAEYQKAHVMAHPSRNESFGMVILEAMSSGLPIVATNVEGIPFLVTDQQNGLLVPPSDPALLARALIRVLSDHDLARTFGEAGRKKAAFQFDWKSRAEEYQKIFVALSRPRIVHVSGYYPPHIGGMEHVAEGLAGRLADAMWRVTVLTSDIGGGIQFVRNGNLIVRRLRSFEFAHTPIAPSLLWYLLFLPHRSIVHIHLSQAYWPELVLLMAKLRRIPYIVHFHLDVGPSGTFGKIFLLYKRILWGPLLRGSRRVVTCSEEIALMLEERYGIPKENFAVVPNAIDDAFFVESERVPATKTLRLLYVGRLVPQKRVDRIIDTLSLMTRPVSLTIVGDGEDRAALEEQANAKVKGMVTFVGFKNETEIRRYHYASDVLVMASVSEGGTPIVALEAMASGLPVVGADAPGVRDLLKDGSGVLIQEPFEKECAKHLDILADDRSALRTLSDGGRMKAKNHTWQNMRRMIERMYISIHP
jgi:glycosyltransferase involved in cell wall biosynthesis